MHTELTKRWPKFPLNSKHTGGGIKIMGDVYNKPEKNLKNNWIWGKGKNCESKVCCKLYYY